MAVDVTVHHHVVYDLPVPLGQRWRVPGQFGSGGRQAHHSEVLWVTAGQVFLGADLFAVLFSVSRAVLGAELEDVGGALVQAGDGEVVVGASEVTGGVCLLLFTPVAQSVAHHFAHHLFRGLPLDQSCVPDGGANDHGGLAGNYQTEMREYLLFCSHS